MPIWQAMKLNFENSLYILTCTFEERVKAQEAKFYFDDSLKKWVTDSAGKAKHFIQYADDKAKLKILQNCLTINEYTAPLPAPIGKTFREYQHRAGQWALSRNRSYLALDMGLGKTPIAVGITNARPGKTLFITPPFLKFNVEREIKAWSIWFSSVAIVKGPKDKEAFEADYVILPDSILHRKEILDEIKRYNFEWCFIDEAHRFCNESLRTKALFGHGNKPGIISHAIRVVSMSGTPMPNRPKELWPVIKACAHDLINGIGYFDYAKKYCAGYMSQWGFEDKGESNLDELSEKISSYMLRQTKKECLTELPEKIEQVIYLDMSLPKSVIAFEAEAVLNAGGLDNAINELLSGISMGDIATYRREMGEAKVLECCEFIASQIEDTKENFIIFAYHKDVVKKIALYFESDYSPFVITGDTPMLDRQKMVDAFQRGERRLFVGNIHAMGMGLTLTAATQVRFVEYDWSDSINQQASDRAHRLGQNGDVIVQYLVKQNTLDEYILKRLLEKRETVDKFFKGAK